MIYTAYRIELVGEMKGNKLGGYVANTMGIGRKMGSTK